MTITFIILGITILLLLTNKIPMEITALGSAVALFLFGIIDLSEMLNGFSNSTVITIASLFIIGAVLFETGVAEFIASKIISLTKGSELKFLLAVLVLTAVLSGFLSNTGTMAVMIPTIVAASRKMEKHPGQFLMPTAFAASIGGMLTLIGTPPNIVVSDALKTVTGTPFAFFEFAFLGIPILCVYLGYFVLTHRSDKSLKKSHVVENYQKDEFIESLPSLYNVEGKVYRLRIRMKSPLISKLLSELHLSDRFHVNVIGVEFADSEKRTSLVRHLQKKNQYEADSDESAPLKNNDILMAVGEPEKIQQMAVELSLAIQPCDKIEEVGNTASVNEIGVAEAIIPQHSTINHQSVIELRFFQRFRVRVLGILRNGKALKDDFINQPLQFGDQLMLLGSWNAINQLKNDTRNFIVYDRPETIRNETPAKLTFHSYVSVITLVIVVAAMLLNVMPMVVITLSACIFLILSNCIKLDAAYRSINWGSVLLIASMIPMSIALNKTGGAQLVADTLIGLVGANSPYFLLAGIFMITLVFSQFISNTATTILITPIAITAAHNLEITPTPLLMMVAAGASSAFLTPIASPVNTLVLGPGGYQFHDFFKRGIPLVFIVMVLCMIIVPIIWPIQ